MKNQLAIVVHWKKLMGRSANEIWLFFESKFHIFIILNAERIDSFINDVRHKISWQNNHSHTENLYSLALFGQSRQFFKLKPESFADASFWKRALIKSFMLKAYREQKKARSYGCKTTRPIINILANILVEYALEAKINFLAQVHT